MKKLAAIIISFAMIVSLCACTSEVEAPSSQTSPQTQTAEAPSGTASEAPSTETPAQTPAETPVQEPEVSAEEKAEEIMELYKALLSDTQEFVIGKKVYGFEEGEKYLLSDLAQLCTEDVGTEWGGNYDCSIAYGFLDCGSDGIPEMSVELTFSDEENYDSQARYFVFNCLDGTPTVIGGYDFYYRSYSFISKSGIVEYGGSSGAASYYCEYSYINGDGEEQFLYSCSTEMANPKPAIPSYFLPSEIDPQYYEMYTGEEVDTFYTVETYNFTDFTEPYDSANYEAAYDEYCRSNYFTISDEYGEEVAPAEEYVSLYQEHEVKIVSPSEIEDMVHARLEEAGVTEEIINTDYVEYSKLDVTKLRDEVIENEDGSITVGCAANLIDNIRDGAVIYLKPGVYNLGDWYNIYLDEYNYSPTARCRVYPYAEYYSDNIYMADGQVVVNRVKDLTIESLDPDDPAEIVTDDPFSTIISFCECSDVTVKNVIAGHTPGNEGHCSADVFEFNECDRVVVEGCDLYGCGCYGIAATATAGLDVIGGRIHDCTYGMAELYSTYPINFNGVTFENCTDSWTMMFWMEESSADFTGCTFRNLGDMFHIDGSSVWVSGCTMDEAAENSIKNSEYFENTLYLYE